VNILLFSGSFHQKSYSLAILREIESQISTHTCFIPALDALPFYSEDISGDNKPPIILRFLEQVSLADGIVLCSPEYNHSIPGVLKNALDWASRPAFNSPLKDKPISIITQSVSGVGGARAQAHLKLVLDSTMSKIHISHEMMIPAVNKKFDAEFKLIDSKTRQNISRHIKDFMGSLG